MSPAPIVLASVTSSVVSMVNEDSPSTSAGAIPASHSAATTASAASWPSGRSICLANSVCPIPTLAAASRSGLARPPMCQNLPPGGEHDGKGERRSEGHPLDVGRVRAGIEGERPQAVEERVDGHPRLHAGEVHPQADVDAEAESDVLALLAEQVEAVRVDVFALVAVGGADQQCEIGPLVDVHAGQLRVARCTAQDHGYRWLPAQHLFERL